MKRLLRKKLRNDKEVKNEERRVKNSIVMEKIKYMMLSLMMAMVVALPMQAQDVNDDEVVESQDETELADSTLIDSWLLIPRSCLGLSRFRLVWTNSWRVRCSRHRRWD